MASLDQNKVRQLMDQISVIWIDAFKLRGKVERVLLATGFGRPTFPSNLDAKLDYLMERMKRFMLIEPNDREWFRQALVTTGWVDMNPIQVNTLKNLAYLAVAQTHCFEKMTQVISSHRDDYADCELFLTKRNNLIEKLIRRADSFGGQPFGGVCRDTLTSGLQRQPYATGMVSRDLDLLFPDGMSRDLFITQIRYDSNFITTRIGVDVSYRIGGICDTYRVFLKSDTTINVKVDCVYKDICWPVDNTADFSIDFNINALRARWDSSELWYNVRPELRKVVGLTLPEISADIQKKQFRAIGIVMNTTSLTDAVFTDKTAHVCTHRKSSAGLKLRSRADSLIARGWHLVTTCDKPECWLAPLSVYNEFIQKKMEEKRRIKEQEHLLTRLDRHHCADICPKLSDDPKSRGRDHRKRFEKHRR
jgi:hypothetical protein